MAPNDDLDVDLVVGNSLFELKRRFGAPGGSSLWGLHVATASVADVEASDDPAHQFLAAVAATTAASSSTSVRLPAELHWAAREAVQLGWADSMSSLVVSGLRDRLAEIALQRIDAEEVASLRSALDRHYEEYPSARPSFLMVVQSAAELEGDPAAARPDLIERAISEMGEEVSVDDVLIFVRGVLYAEASSLRAERHASGT